MEWIVTFLIKIHREFQMKFEKSLFLYLPCGQPLTALPYSLTCSSPPLQSFYIYPSEIAGMHWFGAGVLAHPPTLWCVMTNLSLLRPIGRVSFFTSNGERIKWQFQCSVFHDLIVMRKLKVITVLRWWHGQTVKYPEFLAVLWKQNILSWTSLGIQCYASWYLLNFLHYLIPGYLEFI